MQLTFLEVKLISHIHSSILLCRMICPLNFRPGNQKPPFLLGLHSQNRNNHPTSQSQWCLWWAFYQWWHPRILTWLIKQYEPASVHASSFEALHCPETSLAWKKSFRNSVPGLLFISVWIAAQTSCVEAYFLTQPATSHNMCFVNVLTVSFTYLFFILFEW